MGLRLLVVVELVFSEELMGVAITLKEMGPRPLVVVEFGFSEEVLMTNGREYPLISVGSLTAGCPFARNTGKFLATGSAVRGSPLGSRPLGRRRRSFGFFSHG